MNEDFEKMRAGMANSLVDLCAQASEKLSNDDYTGASALYYIVNEYAAIMYQYTFKESVYEIKQGLMDDGMRDTIEAVREQMGEDESQSSFTSGTYL